MPPSTALEFKILMERWTGHILNCRGLRVFSFAAYTHVRWDKIQLRALKCVFLGYPKGVKGYCLWCVEHKKEKYVISRYVVFDERHFPLLTKVLYTKKFEAKKM